MKDPTFIDLDRVETLSVMPQRRSGREASINLKILFDSESLLVSHTRYDAGYVVDRHTHDGDEIIFVLDGEIRVGDRVCLPSTAIVLEKGTPIGPIYAGQEGATMLEVFVGRGAGYPHSVDPDASRRLFESLGIVPLGESRDGGARPANCT